MKKKKSNSTDPWIIAEENWEELDIDTRPDFLTYMKENFNIIPKSQILENTFEKWIMKRIEISKKEADRLYAEKNSTYKFGDKEFLVYPPLTWAALWYRTLGELNAMYMCITGHDNKYNDDEK